MPKCFDKSTSIFGVIGDPVSHSLSPFIHNRLYELYDINALYLPLFINKGGVDTTLPALIKALGLKGFNITMPHKQAILPLLGKLSPDAELFGSVNTVLVGENGSLSGYNTDGRGYVLAMEELGLKLENLSITILGSGGVAATLALHLASIANNRITLVTIDEAGSRSIVAKNPHKIDYLTWNADNLREAVQNAALLINTTPLGMTHCDDFSDLSFLEYLPQDAPVSDLIYAPAKTTLLSEAERKGHIISNGLSMLIWQAFIAFEYSLGVLPDHEDKKVIEKDLIISGLGI